MTLGCLAPPDQCWYPWTFPSVRFPKVEGSIYFFANLHFILQWVKPLKQKPKLKVGKTRKSPRVPEIPVCYVESSDFNGKGVKSPKAKATRKSPRATVKSPKAKATRKSPRATVKYPKAKATRKSPRATVKCPKAKAAQTSKPVCQVICILPVSPLLQGFLHMLRVPLIKPLIVVVVTSPTHILCQLNHRVLWKVRRRIPCRNNRRVTAVSGCPLLPWGAGTHFLLGQLQSKQYTT